MYKEDFIQTEQAYFYHNYSDEPSRGYILHCHAFYEIFYFLEGNIDYRVEGKEYLLAPGSVLLIPPNTFHGVKVNTSHLYHRFSIHFLPELLTQTEQELLLPAFHNERAYYPSVETYRLDHFFTALLECRDFGVPLQAVALKARIMALLTQIAMMSAKESAIPSSGNRTVQEIIPFVNENIRKPITLETLAEKFFVSKNHLNVIFQKATGTTINQYIRMKRLSFAQNEILRGVSACEAAVNAGFNDYSNFYRAFRKEFGYAPSQHRVPSIRIK